MTNFKCPTEYRSVDSDTAKLLELLGERTFMTLQKAFGGRRVWIPKHGTRFPCGACDSRDNCIRLWRKQGRSVASIAEHLRVSPKTVYRVLETTR